MSTYINIKYVKHHFHYQSYRTANIRYIFNIRSNNSIPSSCATRQRECSSFKRFKDLRRNNGVLLVSETIIRPNWCLLLDYFLESGERSTMRDKRDGFAQMGGGELSYSQPRGNQNP